MTKGGANGATYWCVLSLFPTPPTLKDEHAGGSCWPTLIKIVADTNISWGSPPPPTYIAGETLLVLNRVGGPPRLCGGQCVLIVTIYPWTLTCCWPQGLLCSECLSVQSIPSLTLACCTVFCIVLCPTLCPIVEGISIPSSVVDHRAHCAEAAD